MQVLQTFEGEAYILLVAELFGFLAQELFKFQIFAEVIVSEVFVYFELIVELFHGSLIVLPEVGGIGGGHLADLLEFGLNFLYAGKRAVDIVSVGRQGLKLLDEGKLALEIFTALLLLGCCCGRFAFAQSVHECLELLLCRVEGGDKFLYILSLGNPGSHLGFLFGLAQSVETLFETRDFLARDVDEFILGQLGEACHHLVFGVEFAFKSFLRHSVFYGFGVDLGVGGFDCNFHGVGIVDKIFRFKRFRSGGGGINLGNNFPGIEITRFHK